MSVIDISRTLSPAIAVWPGDTPFQLQPLLALARGDSVNLTTLTLSAHTGSHIDAPAHFAVDGATVEALSLSLYWGPAQVVSLEREAGALTPDDLGHIDLRRAPRLLLHSRCSALPPEQFPQSFLYPAPELATYLGQQGIILLGTDAPSMDHADSKALPGHHALRRQGIAILEGLDLSGVEDGLYELVALPLKLAGGDGSPVRAALRPLGAG